jgi:hypothetical protein
MRKQAIETYNIIPDKLRHLKHVPILHTFYTNIDGIKFLSSSGVIYMSLFAGEYYHSIPIDNPDKKSVFVRVFYEYEEDE